MPEIFIPYTTATGLEKRLKVNPEEICINLDLRDIATIDLLPLAWCSKLEDLNIRNNQLTEIDLSPLEKCSKLRVLRLNNNLLQTVDLAPLENCSNLIELALNANKIRRLDISPLFHCHNLVDLNLDDTTSLLADLTLKSVGSWPDVLVERFHRILWKVPEEA
jgi:Leucine-rich repeat (LRR) protein